jgi:hypothetical protein
VDIDHVKVVNPASDPVPVTGNVKAIQSGAWNVAINGTPTVNVASAPPVNVNFPSTISVTNPFASPSQLVPLVVTGDTVDFVTILFNGSYSQVRPDGSATNFTLQLGQSLVITDVNWQALCTQIQGCTKSVGDQVSFFLGNFYVSTDTYKGLPCRDSSTRLVPRPSRRISSGHEKSGNLGSEFPLLVRAAFGGSSPSTEPFSFKRGPTRHRHTSQQSLPAFIRRDL